jgi:hypothetical protein
MPKLVKGSTEAKEYMAKLRKMKGGKRQTKKDREDERLGAEIMDMKKKMREMKK